jgi:hypothetical protein
VRRDLARRRATGLSSHLAGCRSEIWHAGISRNEAGPGAIAPGDLPIQLAQASARDDGACGAWPRHMAAGDLARCGHLFRKQGCNHRNGYFARLITIGKRATPNSNIVRIC